MSNKIKILKISDGFVTNSSTVSTTIIIAHRRGMDLGETLEIFGLSSDYKNRLEDWGGMSHLIEWVNLEYLNSEYISDFFEEYTLLSENITVDAFGGDYEDIEWSDFRIKFYDEMLGKKLPKRLVGNDLIFIIMLSGYRNQTEEICETIWSIMHEKDVKKYPPLRRKSDLEDNQ